MNILKSLWLPVLTGFLLIGCDAAAPLIEVQPENVDKTPVKVASLSDDQLKSWGFQDLAQDTIPGMSVERTYAELIKGSGQTVIVAVIDSGVDILHEDLKNVIWTNTDEIPNNNKDDDKNGYVDDVHGWNFLGDMTHAQLEYTRIVQRYQDQFKGKVPSDLPTSQRPLYDMYQKAKAEYDKEYNETLALKSQYEQMVSPVKDAHATISAKLGKENYTLEEVSAIKADTESMQRAKSIVTQMLQYADTIPDFLEQLTEGIEYFTDKLNHNLNINGDYRSVLGDDPYDYSAQNYGNNQVMGPDVAEAEHGTHVSGIIAAQRNNGIGMDGVASNVKIMPIRTVPDGDEYDKDVALAIRYAVDNGAQVINCSFGKYFSQNPQWVYDALKYAGSKDVLVVIAAGNNSQNLDLDNTVFPNDQLADNKEFTDNVLTVGAIGPDYGGEMVAPFSNYGRANVDVFAPGMQIWSTIPNSEYKFQQGTSMAAPAVAGVAAALRSYYPQYSAAQIKKIIMDSGLTSTTSVILEGDPTKTAKFSEISSSGSIVNMYNAFKQAQLSAQ
ncbi:S8 family serine peptidase [Croceiramulus getboli]|nr:S8 family serine peptidase [Flavobacteriaceae bacterium YJPT1-3]